MAKKEKEDKKEKDEISEAQKELDNLLEELSKGENNAPVAVKIDSRDQKMLARTFFKNPILDVITKFLVSFLMMFTLNQFIPFMEGEIYECLIFSFASIALDILVQALLEKPLALINLVSGGIASCLVTAFIFFGIGLLLKFVTGLKFLQAGWIILDLLLFLIIRRFLYRYFKFKLLKL